MRLILRTQEVCPIMSDHHRIVAPLALVLALIAAPSARAQQQSGRIDGVVTDATGAVVPGATVTLTGAATAQLETTTSQNGDYHFLNLSPGTYAVTAKLPGFTDVLRENVIVQTGGSTRIDLQMRPSGVAETVTVTGASPVVDTRRMTNETTFDQTQLQEIPTARDPWVLLQQAPGVLVDRVNVGGNESGQQSTFIRGASDGSDTMWNLDGIMITDPSSIGSTPTYYDFDAFQEVQFTTGGNDARQQTGGIGINFVTKRGTNQFRGSGRFFGTNKDLQSHNIGSEILSGQPTFGHPCATDSSKRCGNEIDRVMDFGVEVGGPVVKDKVWFWGAAAKNDIKNIIITGDPDNTQLIDYNAKVDWQANAMHRFNFLYFRGNKEKQGRNAGITRPPETTWNQTGPTNLYKVEDNITIGNATFIAARYAFINGAFTLAPQGGRDANVFYEGGSGTYHGSYLFYDTTRPQHQFQVDGNHFLGKQEIKFGFQYRHTIVTSLSSWPGNKVIADIDDGLAFIVRDAHYEEKEQIVSGYAGDTITWNRLTASLNLRWDRQWGNNQATSSPANPVFPELLPALNFQGRPRDFTWNDFSPRVGVTYALDESRKTIARANYGRYAGQIYTGLIAFDNPLSGVSELDYGWTDRNGDKVVQRSELDFSYLAGSYYVDPANPTATTPPNRIDPDFKAPISQDFILGIDREVMPNFAIGAAFNWGSTTDVIWYPLVGITRADFVANPTPVTGTVNGVPYSTTWYRLRTGVHPQPGNAQLLTNRPDYEARYTGFQLTANKRLANRWMLKSSFAWNNPTRHISNPNTAIQDPTSTQYQILTQPLPGPLEDDSVIAAPAGNNSGAKADVFINSKWQFNVAGLYQFGYGINVAANLLGRQGYPNVYYHRVNNPDAFTTFIRIKPFEVDQFRNPDVYTLDGRVEKEIHLQRTTVIVLAEGFNLLNKSDVLQIQSRVNTATFNQVREVLSPRIIRFGARVTF
jgi:carboxypeptidase family protein/TonB-dependent receptor-like protein